MTNNIIINIEQHNLRVVNEPSEALFAFTRAVIGIKIQAIQPEACFLFTSLAKLTLLADEEQVKTYHESTTLPTVNIFETVSSLHGELFVELKINYARFNSSYRNTFYKFDVTLCKIIGKARKRFDAFNMTDVRQEQIGSLFAIEDEEDGSWPRLIELNMYACDPSTLTNPKLFEKLVPSLRKLNLGDWNTIRVLAVDVFKHADKLLELDINLSEINKSLFTNEIFHGLENLRVLNLIVLVDSLEFFNCLCNLEELRLVLNEKSSFKRLDAFPSQLFKLRVLQLDLKCKVEWIAPSAFDHLTCLEWFELNYRKCESVIESRWDSMQLLEIGLGPRFLKVVGVKTLRLVGCASSVANIETLELFESDLKRYGYHGVQLTKLECDWPLSGLKRLSAMPSNGKSLALKQMANLEFLRFKLSDLDVLVSSELSCLCKLKELIVDIDYNGLCCWPIKPLKMIGWSFFFTEFIFLGKKTL
jgi:hypothetical protein